MTTCTLAPFALGSLVVLVSTEKRRLLIVPREAPLGPVHLENMTKLFAWGAQIMPACPGFYHLPKNLDDLLDQFVFRIMDVFGLESPIKRWGDRLSK